ncbi:recombinase family protein [Archaeoglobus sp.]
MKAALYVRVSTEEQAKEGFSIPAQLGRLEAYCKSKGWRIYDEYIDDGYTGREKERPAYAEMMQDIEYWDVLLTLKIDRVHRNLRNFLEMFDTLQVIISISQPFTRT